MGVDTVEDKMLQMKLNALHEEFGKNIKGIDKIVNFKIYMSEGDFCIKFDVRIDYIKNPSVSTWTRYIEFPMEMYEKTLKSLKRSNEKGIVNKLIRRYE